MAVLTQAFPRRTFVNSAAIFAGEGFCRLATFVMAIIVARQFGPVALGQYGYALALASVLLLVPDLGLHLLVVRELAAEPWRLRSMFWSLHWLKLLLTGGVIVFTLAFGQVAVHDGGKKLLLYILVFRVLLQSFSQAYSSIFKAFERMQYIALQQFVNAALVVVWAGAASAVHASLGVVVAGLLVGQAAETWLGWSIVQGQFSPGNEYEWDWKYLGTLFAACAPIGFTALLQALNLRLDILALSLFVPNSELGNFQAAAWFPIGSYLFASLLMTVLFPKLSRILRAPSPQASEYIGGLLKNGMLLMTLGTAIVWLGAPIFLRWCFGGSLISATETLRVLSVSLPFVFLNTAMFYVLVAAQRRGAYLGALIFSVALGSALNLYLGAHFHSIGSAFADMIREFAVTIVFLWLLVRAGLAPSAGAALLKILAASACLIGLGLLFAGPWLEFTWPPAWSFLVLAGTVMLLGFPHLREVLLLSDDQL